MNRSLVILSLVSMACATKGMVKQDSDERPEIPGGNCFWAVHEGGAECEVEIGTESRTRVAGTTDDILGTEGYGRKKWKCGEKREVCGSEVECTCPFPPTSPDGGS